MGEFDFRDMLGGASGAVNPDDALADGANADHAPGLCGHLLASKDGMSTLVEHFARSIVWTSNLNGICCGGVLALIVTRLAELAYREVNEAQRVHLVAEVQAALDGIKL